MLKILRVRGFGSWLGNSRAVPARRKERRVRPRLEALEERAVPAVLTDREQYMIELINQMRMDPHGEVQRILNANDPNVTSAINFFHVDLNLLKQEFAALSPAAPVAWDARLYAAALGHSQAMITADQQSHQLSGEPDVGTRITNQGYNWNAFGENIFAFATSVFEGHAAFAIDWGNGTGGMENGRGHRANIMDPGLREVGVGILDHTPPTSNDVGPLVITQDFGNRFNFGNPWLLGVVFSDANKNGFYDPGEGLGSVNVTAVQVGGTATGSTTTLATGAYQLQLPAGTYTVTFSGGGLAAPVVDTATIGASNVKLDVGAVLSPPTIQFSSTSSHGGEGISTVNLALTLSNRFNQPVTVDYSVTGGSATGGGVDYDLPSGTLTFQPGQTSAVIPVRIFNDALSEANETLQVTLSNPTNGSLGSDTVFTYTIDETDPLPVVNFAVTAASGLEGATPAIVPVVLSARSGQTVTVNYAVSGGTAINGTDYNLASGTLTFTPGQTVHNIAIPIADDSLSEPNETIQVTLSGPAAAVLGLNRTFTYTIVDNDPLPAVSFDATTSSADESVTSPTTVTVSLVDANGKTVTAGKRVTVSYVVIAGGSATAGVDYTLPTGTLTFAPGVSQQTIPLTLKDDGRFENNETVRIALFAPVNATLGNNVIHTFTILETDPPPTVSFSASSQQGSEATALVNLTVTLSATSGLPVQVDYGVTGGTAVNGGVDYSLPNGTLTFLPGQTTRTIPLFITHDTRNESDKTIGVTLANPVNATLGTTTVDTYTITDGDPSLGTAPDTRPSVGFDASTSSGDESVASPTSVTVSLLDSAGNRTTSAKPVAVYYVVIAGGTATSGLDYTLPIGKLTFAPGVSQQTIPLTLRNDARYENNETVRIALFAPVNAVLGNNVIHTFTILETDPAPTVSFSTSSQQGSEATTLVNLTVTLSGPSALPVQVDYAVTSGTAANGGVDYSLPNGTLTFLPGQTTRTLPVIITNDAINEDSESFQVTLSNPVNAALGANPADTYTILDNDPPPSVRFLLPASSGNETATPGVVAVVLSAPSDKTVTVDYSVPTDGTGGTAIPNTDYVLNNGTLTFVPGQTTQYIRFDVVDDLVNEPNETFRIQLSNPANAVLAAFNTRHTFTIVNNDPPPRVSFAVTQSSGAQGTTVSIEVDLSAASGQAVTVSYRVVGGTAKNGVDYTLLPGKLTFAPGVTSQTITLQIATEAAPDPMETVQIALFSPLNATLGFDNLFTYSILAA
jgi:hypothetical protein